MNPQIQTSSTAVPTIGQRLADSARETARSVGAVRIPELLLGTLLIVEAGFGLPVGVNQIAMIALIGLAVTQRPQRELSIPNWVYAAFVIGLFYIAMISLFADPSEFAADWKRRLIRLMLTSLVVLVVASGRIDIRSLLVGVGAGLFANTVLFYAGLAPDTYGGVLSGYLEDKNVAGLAYAVYGILLLSLTQKLSWRILIIAAAAVGVWLTGSRTSIAAFGAALIWVLLAPRLVPLLRAALAGILYWVTQILAEDYSRIGRFSSREGSDLLRSRIDAASQLKVEDTGFWGAGLGEAYVEIEDRTWYFHNSYWSALVEGGWLWLTLVLILTIGIGLSLVRGGRISREIAIGQGAILVLLLCSFRLGEVLFTLPWAVALGYCLRHQLIPVRSRSDVATRHREEVAR